MLFFKNLRVRSKLALLIIILTIIPGLVIFSVFQIEEKKFQQDYSQAYGNIAQNILEMIDRNLFERYGDVQAFGYNAAAHNAANWKNPSETNPLVNAMNNYAKAYGFYPLMIMVSPQGDVLAVNSKSPAGAIIDTYWIYNQNFKDAPWFKDVIAGKFLKGTNGLTGTAVQPPQQDPIVQKVYKNDGFVIPFSAEVRDDSGTLLGVWVNYADFSLVETIIGAERKKMLEEGYVDPDLMLFDNRGTQLVDYDPQNIDEKGNLERDFDGIILKKNFIELGNQAAKLASEGKSGFTQELNPDDGTENLFAYASSKGAYDYPGLGWMVVMGSNPKDVFVVLNTVEKDMIIALVALVLTALLISLWLGKAAAKPLNKATATMSDLAQGKLETEIAGMDQKDEFGDISRALQVFKESMIETRSLSAKQEEMKREAELEKKSSMNMLANDFDSRTSGIIQALASAATEMQATANQMTSSSSNTAQASALVAAAATEADSNVQTVASASEELSASSAEIAKQISSVAQKSTRASHEAETTSHEVSELNSLADSIGEVVGAIKGIAEQTNLLALNATIEAARAGEAGKGFAVVADEVKKLAMETAQKTEQIDERVGKIQHAIRSSVEAVQRIISDVRQIDEATTTVASAVEEQYAATAEIGRNVAEASTGTQQVAQTIISVQRNAEETGQAASTVLEAAGELARISTDLQEQVKEFLDEIRNA